MLRLITSIIFVIFASSASAYELYKVENNQIAVKISKSILKDSAEEYDCYVGDKVYTIKINNFFEKDGFDRGTLITLTGSQAGTGTQYCQPIYPAYTPSTGEEVELEDGRTGIFYED